jgi:hypothetical protein
MKVSGLIIRRSWVRAPAAPPGLAWSFLRFRRRLFAVFRSGASEVLAAPLASFGTTWRGTTWATASAAARATPHLQAHRLSAGSAVVRAGQRALTGADAA